MPRQCLCQLCNCGRHKCDRHAMPPPPCGDNCITEYRNKYTRKPWAETKSFKPDNNPVQSDAPAEDKTTNRVDYVRHPVHKPVLHNPDPYMPPEGAMDGLTSYRKEYTRKPVERMIVSQPKPRKLPGEFDGNTNNKIDYQRWNVAPHIRRPPDPYMPPAAPFDSNSSYRTSYNGQTQPVRPSMKPDNNAVQSDAPLDNLTTSRVAYVRHPLPEIEPKQHISWAPNPAQLDGLTNYRKEFTTKGGERQPSCKPDQTPVQSDAPFVGATTNRCDYTQWPTKRPDHHLPDPYMPPEGPMATMTTNRRDFNKKPLDKNPAYKPKERRRPAGQFENLTTNRVDYRNWGRVDPPHYTMRDKYEPIDAPFDGLATYTSSYVRHNEPPRASMKPPNDAVQSDAPLQNHTEYRGEFTRKPIEPCLAGVLKAGNRCGGHANMECYNFVEKDSFGHDWYEPVTNVLPGIPVA